MMSDRFLTNGDMSKDKLSALWEQCCSDLAREIGHDRVDQWIRPIALTAVEKDLAILAAPTNFLADYVERNFGLQILRVLQRTAQGIRRIDLTVAVAPVDGVKAGPKPVAAESPPARVAVQAEDDLPSAPLDPRFTFDSFVVGKPNELAHAAARRVAESPDPTFNPVFLYGGVGLGKTHLMHAIGTHLLRHRPQARVVYLSAEQFMYRFVQALRFRDTMTFKQQFRSVDVLMIDDVQFIAGKDSTQDEFFHTFNALIDQKKQIVISGDRSPDRIDGMEDRIKSRLQWGLVVDIHPTDYELRLGILQQKAESIQATAPDVVLDPKVLEFLARRINQNVRVLEGALTRLFAYALLVGRPVDMEMTRECLADLLRIAERKITIEDIKRRVCEHYHLKMNDLTSARRARAVARPRQVAMYLSKTLTAKSLPEIGRLFGGRDHTTVLHAVKRIEELRATDTQTAEDLELLRRMLEA
ncbi:MAG: chromosomal replication initiator protein DnaA [Paracoccaceae bacterium]